MSRLGIMGGTFDPIHLGHLAAAEAAQSGFCLDKVIFVPAGNPPHKTRKLTPGVLRLEMVREAVTEIPAFEVSDYEIIKAGKSYSIKTVEFFREKYGKEWEIFFITGSDAVLEITTWHDVSRLATLCSFIAVTRPGYGGWPRGIQDLPPYLREKIFVLEVPGLNISSTQIREKVGERQSIQDLVPSQVENIIERHNLYRKPNSKR